MTPLISFGFKADSAVGSLLVVLLLRTAHYNLSKLKDVYLHTNTLAALANLAPHINNLSSHAAQRLVSLFDMLSRRSVHGASYSEYILCIVPTLLPIPMVG